MNYRTLGRTGIQAGEIGIGCEGFLEKSEETVKQFIDLMEEAGANCIDLYSPNPDMRSALGKALRGRREKFVLEGHLCAVWKDGQYKRTRDIAEVKEGFEDQLKRLGVGITVMKAFGGGDLLSEELSPAGKALTPYQCLHYALSRPGVACVMAGARSTDDLKRSLAYEEASDEEKDYAEAFAAFPKISWKGHCMYCGHCAPCPKGIDVASVTKFLNLVRAQGEIPETVREHYAVLPHTASECVRCGACEKCCPFQVPVMKNMEEAADVFGR